MAISGAELSTQPDICNMQLRVNVCSSQTSAAHGFADRADFQICYAVLDADFRGVVRFPRKCLRAELC